MELLNDFIHPYIFISGEGVLFEGEVKIIRWEENCIILQCRERIKVSGERLSLKYKGDGCIGVVGKILSLEFER